MPAVRLSRRRKSSLGLSFSQAKAGIYGVNTSPRPVTFAPNVTPVSYTDDIESSPTPEPSSPKSALFPPSETPAPSTTRRRVPPGKRRSLGYIPRPPNAFMLFRADFVRQKHVPGSIETNHGSLSKIIGNCWRSLPLEEKHIWEVKAKHAKAEHKARYPEYRFRPVHNKNKEKKKEKPTITAEEERRCEEVAALLLEGKKGEELAAAVRARDQRQPNTHRRSSSVPLPNDYYPQGIALPSVPFLSAHSRPASPARFMLGSRRASSAGARPIGGLNRSWTLPLQRDNSPLPDVDTSLFEQSFLDAAQASYFPNAMFSNDMLLSPSLPNQQILNHLGPLDVSVSPHDVASYAHSSNWIDSASPGQYDEHPSSHASSAYSGSPIPSPEDSSLPLPIQHLSLDGVPVSVPILSPQPIHPSHDINVDVNGQSENVFTDLWKGLTSGRSFTILSNGLHGEHHWNDETVKNSPQQNEYADGMAIYEASYGQYDML